MNHYNSTFKVKKRNTGNSKKIAGVFVRLKTKEKTKKELWEEYGLVRPAKPRYVGLKGVYWYVLSRYVRQRDFYLYRSCISCGRTVFNWKDGDAGHFIPASACGFALLFDETNVNMQHKSCNNPVWTPEACLGYEKGLDERYGTGTAEGLKSRYFKHLKGTPEKEWSQMEYHQRILDVIERTKSFEI